MMKFSRIKFLWSLGNHEINKLRNIFMLYDFYEKFCIVQWSKPVRIVIQMAHLYLVNNKCTTSSYVVKVQLLINQLLAKIVHFVAYCQYNYQVFRRKQYSYVTCFTSQEVLFFILINSLEGGHTCIRTYMQTHIIISRYHINVSHRLTSAQKFK